MDSTLLIAVATMGGLGLFFAAVLVIADNKWHVQENPLLIKVTDVLPHANCGACGTAGCRDFAMRLIEGNIPVTGCPLGGPDLADKLAEILEMEFEHQAPLVACVMCRGGSQVATRKQVKYDGPRSCALQTIVSGGDTLCFDGCLGGGDCERACPVGAVCMGSDGLPRIVTEICTGCGLCVKSCPRGVIELHPTDRNIFVLCKNQDDPRTARQVCAAACTGCGLCVRFSGGGIALQNHLAVIDYQHLDPEQAPVERCKPGALSRTRG
jgi:Na+-translocating ferredoxin:NAD+ oxidoreductase subunit B